ncbi:AbrB/MazE/SpoVT family DNA-binding domain-containing protein [Xylella fastidiosa]|nr:AbrB/MazE/SpoVT family DNA-binding domain-containing protein [Xylella fastidiosa]
MKHLIFMDENWSFQEAAIPILNLYLSLALNAMQLCITIQGCPNERNAMSTLTVTARGQVTFRKEVLQHLGIKPGERIELDLLPDGRAELKAAQPKGSFQELRGVLKGKTNGARLSIEEINEAIAEAGTLAGGGDA